MLFQPRRLEVITAVSPILCSPFLSFLLFNYHGAAPPSRAALFVSYSSREGAAHVFVSLLGEQHFCHLDCLRQRVITIPTPRLTSNGIKFDFLLTGLQVHPAPTSTRPGTHDVLKFCGEAGVLRLAATLPDERMYLPVDAAQHVRDEINELLASLPHDNDKEVSDQAPRSTTVARPRPPRLAKRKRASTDYADQTLLSFVEVTVPTYDDTPWRLIASAPVNPNDKNIVCSTRKLIRKFRKAKRDPGSKLFHSRVAVFNKLYWHIADKFSITAGHCEDGSLRSLNVGHVGSKIWILIAAEHRVKLEQFINRLAKQPTDEGQACDQKTRHMGIFVSPSVFESKGIKHKIVIRGPGTFVVTAPG
ncbi:lysine-specific demethylase 4 [Fusarium beomiforme]|uniref:Lysine-specific demethylase 4 n=1 Tax=Fusarium beomiforme TaxID=44412 RepID=A0A9P5E0T3_9HYPO|nr:lysine-specific demethylase 4 [Fusarium beomiforme]